MLQPFFTVSKLVARFGRQRRPFWNGPLLIAVISEVANLNWPILCQFFGSLVGIWPFFWKSLVQFEVTDGNFGIFRGANWNFGDSEGSIFELPVEIWGFFLTNFGGPPIWIWRCLANIPQDSFGSAGNVANESNHSMVTDSPTKVIHQPFKVNLKFTD